METQNANHGFWKDYQAKQKQRRMDRRMEKERALALLRADGYEVDKITAYHYRINGILDVFPTHSKYHDLTTSPHEYHEFPDGELYKSVNKFFRDLHERK